MKTIAAFGSMVLLVLACSAAQAATITLVADEWCPYNCTPGSDEPGYMIEIAERVFGDAGHRVEYRTMPWSRAIEEARRGRFDGIVGAAAGDAPDFVYPASRLGVGSNVFYVRRGDGWRFETIDSLASISLGTIRDYSYGDELDEYVAAHAGDEARVQIASGDTALDTNFRKLAAGRIGALVEDHNVAENYFAGSGTGDRFEVAGSLGDDDLFIAFSPATPNGAEYARLLSEGVARLRASGELAAILKKYGVRDWQ